MRRSAKARWRPHTHAHSDAPKIRYADESEAVTAALRLADADLYNGMAFRRTPCAYPCADDECGGWHVGNWSDEAYRASQKAAS